VDLTLIDGFRGKRFRHDGLVGKTEPFHHGVRHSRSAAPQMETHPSARLKGEKPADLPAQSAVGDQPQDG